MFKNTKIWQLIIVLFIIIIVTQFSSILNIILLWVEYVLLLITDFSVAASQTSFEILEHLFSCLMVIFLPIYFLFWGRKHKVFNAKIDFPSTVLVILAFFFFFSPIIITTHPEFQKNIGITKLLPPLSKINLLKLEVESKTESSSLDRFLYSKKLAVKSSFDENVFFVDSIKTGKIIHYFQNGKQHAISKDSLKIAGMSLLISQKTFLLGTDEYGRDIFSRLVYGARISLFVGISAVVLSFLLGMLFGFAAGYFGGITNSILNRLADTFLAFPSIFLIIIILALFGNSIFSVIIVLGFSGWMSLFKIVRAEVISLKQKDFFISAEMIGLSNTKLLIKEVLPILLTPITINLIFQFGNVILAEAALSYLGLGTGTNYPSWGNMIEAGQNYLKNAWWMIFFPGAILILTLYSANDIGQKIKVHFNPQLQK
ncbi:MAG: ABC transporter permease [Ignavibacteriaceae bacterium]|nr:ABC transporter permease [Ignavibacteriaceae bacterium]